MRRGLVITSAVLLALVASGTAYALLTQQGVKTTRLYEQLPAAAVDGSVKYFAWTQNSRADIGHSDAFLTRTGDARIKLNPSGRGFVGGIDPPMVAYQQVTRGQSNIKLYNADTHARTSPPADVNTDNWEWEPSISGDWLLFGRQNPDTKKEWVVLHSLSSATQVVLDSGVGFRHPDQVSGDFAVWTRCTPTCDVYRRQISNSTDLIMPKPRPGQSQYGAAVTSTGIVYAARGGSSKCSAATRIVRFFGASDPPTGTVVAELGSGRYLWSAYARENGDGSVDVFYDRLYCAKLGAADIYRVHDPHPGP